MTSTRAIAAAQTIPIRGDVDANIERHLLLIRVAGRHGAQVVVFPELSLTGYELELASELAFSENDARLEPLIEAASSYSTTLIVGAPVRIGTLLHIGAFILSPDRALALYTKHHLGAFSPSDGPDGVVPPAEATVFQPGRQNPLVQFGGNTGAVAVCADTWRPSHPREAAARGAKTYLAGAFTIASHLEATAASLSTTAATHSMTVVFANYGAPSGGLASGGRSAIWSDRGELLAELGATGEGVVVATETSDGWRARAVVNAAS